MEENGNYIANVDGELLSSILIDNILFAWGKNPTNTTNTLAVGDIISNGRISQDAHIYSAIYDGGVITDFGTLENNFTDGSYRDVFYEDYSDIVIELKGSVTEDSDDVYSGGFSVKKGEPNEIITLDFGIAQPSGIGTANVYLDDIDNGVYLNEQNSTLTTTVNLDSNGFFLSLMTIEEQLKVSITITARSSGETEGIGQELIIDTNII